MISSFFGTPTLAVVIRNIEEADEGKVIVFDVVNGDGNLPDGENTIIEGWEFVQTEAMTTAGIAVHKYGAYIIPVSADSTPISVQVKYQGSIFEGDIDTIEIGGTVNLTNASDDSGSDDEGDGGGDDAGPA